jgi:hypothetical protein
MFFLAENCRGGPDNKILFKKENMYNKKKEGGMYKRA